MRFGPMDPDNEFKTYAVLHSQMKQPALARNQCDNSLTFRSSPAGGCGEAERGKGG
jgi:hypothetical protein